MRPSLPCLKSQPLMTTGALGSRCRITGARRLSCCWWWLDEELWAELCGLFSLLWLLLRRRCCCCWPPDDDPYNNTRNHDQTEIIIIFSSTSRKKKKKKLQEKSSTTFCFKVGFTTCTHAKKKTGNITWWGVNYIQLWHILHPPRSTYLLLQ